MVVPPIERWIRQWRLTASAGAGSAVLFRCPAMSVEVTQHPELRAVMDLFVKLMQHERCFVVLGVPAGNGAQRLPPRILRQLMEQALPEGVGTFQDGDGFGCGCRCRVMSLKARGLSLDAQPPRIPDSSVAFNEVPQPPRDRREGRDTRGARVIRLVLVHFVAAGLDQAVLETDDFRLPAVRTYLRLGFVPEPRTPGDARRWSKVLRNLARTESPA